MLAHGARRFHREDSWLQSTVVVVIILPVLDGNAVRARRAGGEGGIEVVVEFPSPEDTRVRHEQQEKRAFLRW